MFRAFLLWLCLFLPATAEAKDLALGLGISSRTSGLSAFSDLHNQVFFQGLFGISGPSPMLVGDVARKVYVNPTTTGYIGGGVLLHPGGVGLRVPMGVYVRPTEVPLLLNFDVAPGLVTSGDTVYSVVDVTLGLRFLLD